MKFVIVLSFLLIFFISCDYGYSDGSDLEGQWAAVLAPGKNVSYKFYGDGTGSVYYTGLDLFGLEAEAKTTGITYYVSYGNPYRKLHIDLNDDEFANTYGKDSVYDYYFTNNKTYLYMRKRNHNYFIGFMKIKDL